MLHLFVVIQCNIKGGRRNKTVHHTNEKGSQQVWLELTTAHLFPALLYRRTWPSPLLAGDYTARGSTNYGKL